MCCSVIGTGERTCTSDGAGNAGSAKELSRGVCVCACVYGCVSMYGCVYAGSSKETICVHTYHSLLGF